MVILMLYGLLFCRVWNVSPVYQTTNITLHYANTETLRQQGRASVLETESGHVVSSNIRISDNKHLSELSDRQAFIFF